MAVILVGILTATLSARLFFFVNEFSVNIPYWDQWDFLRPFFADGDLLSKVAIQHGPHRQGLGSLLLSVLYPWTHWNIRVECFVAAATLLVTAGVYLWTKVRLTQELHVQDVVIPLLILSLLQYELFVGAPNPSHGPLPAFLISMVALSLTIQDPVVRGFLLASLSIISTYTGFAFFNGLIGPVWIIWDWWNRSRRGGQKDSARWQGAAAIVAVLGTGSFFINYRSQPAIECFIFPHSKPLEYVEFVALMIGRAYGSSSFGLIEGRTPEKWPLVGLESLGLLMTWAWSLRRVVNGSGGRTESVTLYLSSFSLLFAGMTALGRVCGGMVFTMSSRYVPYMIPGIVATYFAIMNALLPGRLRNVVIAIFLGILVLKEVQFDVADAEFIRLRDGKKSWAQCYLEHKDIDFCNENLDFKIHPSIEHGLLKSKLDYLESNGLSFFAQP